MNQSARRRRGAPAPWTDENNSTSGGKFNNTSRGELGTAALGRARERYRDTEDRDLAVEDSMRSVIPEVMVEQSYGLELRLPSPSAFFLPFRPLPARRAGKKRGRRGEGEALWEGGARSATPRAGSSHLRLPPDARYSGLAVPAPLPRTAQKCGDVRRNTPPGAQRRLKPGRAGPPNPVRRAARGACLSRSPSGTQTGRRPTGIQTTTPFGFTGRTSPRGTHGSFADTAARGPSSF